MSIRFNCDCGKVLQAQEENAGKRTKCPACGALLTIPDVDDAVQASPKPAPPTPVQGRSTPRRRAAEDEEEDRDDRDEEEPEARRPKKAQSASSGKALAALLLGIGSFCAWFLTGIPALILGLLSLRDISQSKGQLTGKGMAIIGLILAALNTFLICPAGAFGIWWATSKAGSAIGDAQNRMVTTNNMKQLGLAMFGYADQHNGSLPAAGMPAPNTPPNQPGTPLLSWRVYMLPYLEQENLFRQFRLNEPWDSPHNKNLIAQMPKVFETPGRTTPQAGMTYFQVITTPQQPGGQRNPAESAPFGGTVRPRIPASFMDGTSNTILIVEAANPVIWTKPDDVIYQAGGPMPTFGDPTKDYFIVCLADASARSINRKSISERTLRNAITPADGQLLGPDW